MFPHGMSFMVILYDSILGILAVQERMTDDSVRFVIVITNFLFEPKNLV